MRCSVRPRCSAGWPWRGCFSGLSARRYGVGLEPVGGKVTGAASGTSRSAVSRRFIAATETALAELLARPLDDLDLVAIMIDGVHFAAHCCVVALGIDITGVKHPLALVEGSTENATLARELLVGLRERGLNVTRPTLLVIDGAKALRRAVADVFDHPVIQRCQQHKIKNVKDRLPEKLRGVVERRMRAAYRAESAVEAEAQLLSLTRELKEEPPRGGCVFARGATRDLDRHPPRPATDPAAHHALHEPHREHALLSAASTRPTSSAGRAGRWRCAGVPPACSRRRSSSAV